MDGSLKSTYLHKENIGLETKSSLTSDQSVDAMEYLNHPANYLAFKKELRILAKILTVNME
jgi:hypothetical protein